LRPQFITVSNGTPGCGDCRSWEKNIAVLIPSNSFSHYKGTIPTIGFRVCHFCHYTSHFWGALQLHSRDVSFWKTFCPGLSTWIILTPFISIPKEINCIIFKIKETLSICKTHLFLRFSNGYTLLILPLTFFLLEF
jgi:hypothetical protein